jgi:hypothetical protein
MKNRVNKINFYITYFQLCTSLSHFSTRRIKQEHHFQFFSRQQSCCKIHCALHESDAVVVKLFSLLNINPFQAKQQNVTMDIAYNEASLQPVACSCKTTHLSIRTAQISLGRV